MGNSSSAPEPESNLTEVREIKRILDADTETFNYNRNNTVLSDTSEMNNYTESNANLPYYKEYMDAKTNYLRLKQNGSGSTPTPLMIAVKNGNISEIKKLIEEGCDVDAECEGVTALDYALFYLIDKDALEIAKLLRAKQIQILNKK
jgi:hypothetical protein